MRTSRIARETAQVAQVTQLLTPRRQRQTRSSLASYSASANQSTLTKTKNTEEDSDDTSSLSSAQTQASLNDSEIPQDSSRPSKRRRVGTSATRPKATKVATVSVTTRKSPRKKTVKVEEDVDIEEAISPRPKKARRQPAKQEVDPSTGEVVIHPPANWEEVYKTTQEMRKLVLAPVDTMGCERAGDDAPTPKDRRFQTLIALMLSSQTKDTTNAMTMQRLRTELPPPGLTLSNILDVTPARLNELIYACGFHNNKTRYIKAAAEILRDKYNGDIPDTVEGLTSLPGVGPKMAYLCMSSAWGKTLGIGVDVHVHRITNLWGWHKTKTPEETRAQLEAWLPQEKWHEINHLLVGFGQTICLPTGRDCGACKLSEKGLCPSAVVSRGTKVKRVKKEQVVDKGGGDKALKTELEGEVVEEKELVAEDIP